MKDLRWYSFKRFWTRDAIAGQEMYSFSDIPEQVAQAERSYALERKNRREGLSKDERKEMLNLIKWFKYVGYESRILNA